MHARYTTRVKKLWHFEGLRTVLAIVVLFHHVAAAFYPAAIFGAQEFMHAPWERWLYAAPLAILFNGRLAVFLFFVLTGFFVVYERTAATGNPAAWRFFASRYVRLMLPCAASILLAYAAFNSGAMATIDAAQITRSPWLVNVTPTDHSVLTAFTDGFRSPLWSPVSTYNYNLWPIPMFFYGSAAVFLLTRWWKKGIARTVGLAALALVSMGTMYASFVLGALLADLLSSRMNWNRPTLGWIAVSSGIIVSFFAVPLGSVPNNTYAPGTIPATMNIIYNTIAAGLIISGILFSRRMQRVLSWTPLVKVGRASFSLYVLHILVIETVSTNIILMVTPRLAYHGAVAATLLLTVPAIALTTLLFFRLVERPSHRLAEKIKTGPHNSTPPGKNEIAAVR